MTLIIMGYTCFGHGHLVGMKKDSEYCWGTRKTGVFSRSAVAGVRVSSCVSALGFVDGSRTNSKGAAQFFQSAVSAP